MTKDLPIESSSQDTLEVSRYVEGMAEFIKHCDTPMTISIQGEWGSGKTSFMNLLEKKLCHQDADSFESIWVHTWELFLDDNHEVAVSKLIMNIFRELKLLTKAKKIDTNKYMDTVAEDFKKYCLGLTAMALSALGGDGTSAVDRFSETFEDGGQAKIRELRDKFQALISALIFDKDNGVTNKAFLIFVDDLDRIEPALALTLIEALKNLFDIPGCVFVLAIDYDVISRGVAEKYHLSNDNSRNICHSYFDKVIQVPFVMPVRQYNIYNLVKSKLTRIGITADGDNQENMIHDVMDIISLSVGNNPRAIKRLFNIIQLTTIIEGKRYQQASQAYKTTLILLIAMQLEYPTIYKLIETSGNYQNWKNKFIINAQKVDEQTKKLLGLDQEWKEIVYQLASADEVLQNRCSSIFTLLELLNSQSLLCQQQGEELVDLFQIISVTKVDAFTPVAVVYNGSAYDQSSQTQFAQGNKLIERLDLSQYTQVLDIGCGNGNTTLELLKENSALEITAFDLSPDQIRVAETHRQELGIPTQQLSYSVMNAMDLADNARYDLVFSNATLHWITTPVEMYTKIYQALKVGGTLAVHQGGKDSYCGLHAIARQAISLLGFSHLFKDWSFPVYYPSRKELESLLQSIGFRDVMVESDESSGKEHAKLVENFANASLIMYNARLPETEQQHALQEMYFKLCAEQEVDTYSHRLYIQAKR